jgi:hypothetical protein
VKAACLLQPPGQSQPLGEYLTLWKCLSPQALWELGSPTTPSSQRLLVHIAITQGRVFWILEFSTPQILTTANYRTTQEQVTLVYLTHLRFLSMALLGRNFCA